jgi:curved DNA-binding protein CbpA
VNIYQAAAILGVDANSTQADLKRSWRSCAMMFHPDRNHAPNAEEMFKKVATAFQILADGGLNILKLGQHLQQEVSSQPIMISGPAPQRRRTNRVNDWYWEEQQWLEREFGHLGYWSRNGTQRY